MELKILTVSAMIAAAMMLCSCGKSAKVEPTAGKTLVFNIPPGVLEKAMAVRTLKPTSRPTLRTSAPTPAVAAVPKAVQTPRPTVVPKAPLTYSVITKEAYGVAGAQGVSYRLVLSRKDVTKNELMKIYNELKGTSEVTIWCYSSKEATNGMYDIAMIEGTGANPTITLR